MAGKPRDTNCEALGGKVLSPWAHRRGRPREPVNEEHTGAVAIGFEWLSVRQYRQRSSQMTRLAVATCATPSMVSRLGVHFD